MTHSFLKKEHQCTKEINNYPQGYPHAFIKKIDLLLRDFSLNSHEHMLLLQELIAAPMAIYSQKGQGTNRMLYQSASFDLLTYLDERITHLRSHLLAGLVEDIHNQERALQLLEKVFNEIVQEST